MCQKEVLIKTFPTGMYNSNCYVVSSNREGIIIDAGVDDPAIGSYIKENGIRIKYILCTHSHIDHVLFSGDLKKLTGAKTMLHTEDAGHYKYYTPERINEWIKSGIMNETDRPFIGKFMAIRYDTLIRGGEELRTGDMKIRIIHTPGHSRGSVCLLINGKLLFTGDTIFDGAIGNTDIDSGNYNDIVHSIREIIFRLDDQCVVYPGHGGTCLLKDAKRNLSF